MSKLTQVILNLIQNLFLCRSNMLISVVVSHNIYCSLRGGRKVFTSLLGRCGIILAELNDIAYFRLQLAALCPVRRVPWQSHNRKVIRFFGQYENRSPKPASGFRFYHILLNYNIYKFFRYNNYFYNCFTLCK